MAHAQQHQQQLSFHRAALGVADGADAGALQQAFREASRKSHPDAGGSAAAFQQVHDAYEALTAHAHAERWGTSSSQYGAGAATAQPKLITNGE